MNLADLNLTLADLALGEIDAESDARLAEYFVTTPYVQSVFDGRRTLFLGRKGAGKSAVFTQLQSILDRNGYSDVTVIPITPDQYAWSALKKYQEQGIMPEQAHTNAWKLTLAIEIAGRLVAVERTWSKESKPLIKVLTTFLETNFGELHPSLTQTATSVVRNLSSFNLSAFGFGVGVGLDTGKSDAPITSAIITSLFDVIRPLSQEQPILIALDRLDDSWDGSDASKSLLVGLLKASKEINDQFRSNDDLGLRVLTFLRSDIYDALAFDDKDKHRPTEQIISWDATELQQMIESRLPDGASVGELFEPGDMRGSTKPFNYIAARTFLRPREVLQFIIECIEAAGADATFITKDQIRTAEGRYSKWKVSDLKQEYKKTRPELEDAIECLRQERQRYDNIGDLRALFLKKNPQLAQRHGGVNSLITSVFDVSVVGVRIGDSGRVRYMCEEVDLVLPTNGAFYVHQALHKGLNIRETRRKKNDDSTGDLFSALSLRMWSRMLDSIAVIDINWFKRKATPEIIVMCESFEDCARELSLVLDIDDSIPEPLAVPNKITNRRFLYDRSNYLHLRADLLSYLDEESMSPSEFLTLSREHS